MEGNPSQFLARRNAAPWKRLSTVNTICGLCHLIFPGQVSPGCDPNLWVRVRSGQGKERRSREAEDRTRPAQLKASVLMGLVSHWLQGQLEPDKGQGFQVGLGLQQR